MRCAKRSIRAKRANEDLLFHPREVINQVCACTGGKMREDFHLMEKPSKNHGTGVLAERYPLKKDANFPKYSNDEMKVLLDSLVKGDKDSNAIKSYRKKLKKTQLQTKKCEDDIETKSSRTSLSAATIVHGTKEIRDFALEDDDKKFVGENLNPNVVTTFQYQPP